jgi:hypothetical protein
MSKCDGFLWEAAFEKPDSIVFLLEHAKPFKYSKRTGPKTSKKENKVEILTLQKANFHIISKLLYNKN